MLGRHPLQYLGRARLAFQVFVAEVVLAVQFLEHVVRRDRLVHLTQFVEQEPYGRVELRLHREVWIFEALAHRGERAFLAVGFAPSHRAFLLPGLHPGRRGCRVFPRVREIIVEVVAQQIQALDLFLALLEEFVGDLGEPQIAAGQSLGVAAFNGVDHGQSVDAHLFGLGEEVLLHALDGLLGLQLPQRRLAAALAQQAVTAPRIRAPELRGKGLEGIVPGLRHPAGCALGGRDDLVSGEFG